MTTHESKYINLMGCLLFFTPIKHWLTTSTILAEVYCIPEHIKTWMGDVCNTPLCHTLDLLLARQLAGCDGLEDDSLAAMAERHLGVKLVEALHSSDWEANVLTTEQVGYSACAAIMIVSVQLGLGLFPRRSKISDISQRNDCVCIFISNWRWM